MTSYVTPITDRSALDILNLTSKAYFNLADWQRIYGNAQYVNGVVSALRGITIPFTTISTPAITSMASVIDLNALLASINAIFDVSCLPAAITDVTAVREDWRPGPASVVPDYNDVNQWEYVLDRLLNLNINASNYWVWCGSGAACGQARPWQNQFRRS